MSTNCLVALVLIDDFTLNSIWNLANCLYKQDWWKNINKYLFCRWMHNVNSSIRIWKLENTKIHWWFMINAKCLLIFRSQVKSKGQGSSLNTVRERESSNDILFILRPITWLINIQAFLNDLSNDFNGKTDFKIGYWFFCNCLFCYCSFQLHTYFVQRFFSYMAAFVTFIYQEFYTALHNDHHGNGVASTTGSISVHILW